MTNTYDWTDNPTVSGVSVYDPDVLNDCLMHLKYNVSADLNSKIATCSKNDFSNITSVAKSTAAGLALPSAKYKDLSLGSTGSTYTAPANGWVVFGMQSTAATQNVLLSKDGGAWAISWSHAALLNLYVYVPVTKGEIFKAGYTAGGQKLIFRFYYAEGDAPTESEA